MPYAASTNQRQSWRRIGSVGVMALFAGLCTPVWGQEAGSPAARPAYRSIHEAAEAGARDAVEAFLDQGVDINVRRPRTNDTPLLAALDANRMEVAQYLLDRGADARLRDWYRNTALHFAARWGRRDMCRRLIELGLDVNARNNRKQTPLHLAAQRRRIAAVRLLLENGAARDAIDDNRMSALDYALGLDDPSIAKALLDHGARFAVDEATAVSRIDTVAAKGWRFAVEHALRESENAGDAALRLRILNQAFERAFANADQDLVDFLIDEGAPLDAQAPGGMTRLHQAAELDAPELAGKMIEAGVDLHARVLPAHWTALHFAAAAASPGTASKLVDAGLRVNAADGLRRTPLHIAVLNGNERMVPFLSGHGADVNAQDAYGNAPLHYAATRGSIPIIDALLRAQAQRTARNAEGATPLHCAETAGHIHALPRLRVEREQAVQTPSGFEGVVRQIEEDAGPRGRGEVRQRLMAGLRDGFPLLHLAVRERSPQAVALVLSQEPDARSRRDPFGFQAAHIAAEAGAVRALKLLAEDGASLRDQDNRARWTPLHFAASAGQAEAVQFLLDHGADPARVDGAGRSAADVAEGVGSEAVSAVLRRSK